MGRKALTGGTAMARRGLRAVAIWLTPAEHQALTAAAAAVGLTAAGFVKAETLSAAGNKPHKRARIDDRGGRRPGVGGKSALK